MNPVCVMNRARHLFSPNLVANQPPIFSITPPRHTPRPWHPWRPWQPQLGSSDPESDTPSPSRILSPLVTPGVRGASNAAIQVAESFPLPRSDEPIMSLQRGPAKLSPWQRRDSRPRPSVRSIAELSLRFVHWRWEDSERAWGSRC